MSAGGWWRAGLLALALAGCADGAATTADGAAPDAATGDVGRDVGSDVGNDVANDVGSDVGNDVGNGTPDAPPLPLRETVIPAGARWRYHDRGQDLGAAWREASYDDGAWAAGPARLGFGDGAFATRVSDGASPTSRHRTVYFRHAFELRDAASVRALTLSLLRDDGAVVWLNGREVHRGNLPEGPVSFSTLAATTVGGNDETTFFDAALDPGALRDGRNVLAVEVHQASADSSDLGFDARLALSRSPADAAPPHPVAIAVGDAASCDWTGDEETANLLDGLPGTILALGDLAYLSGTAAEFRDCFTPTWGRLRARMRPAPGNHEYNTPGAGPYYAFFGAAAGPAGRGYYSFELGAWHVVALNSNCDAIGGCDAGSAQHRWLVADLAAHPARCTLAYWHHPRFTSAPRGDNTNVAPLWRALEDAGADVVFSGHEHHYERFAPMRADGTRDDARGIRSFVVGTGGAPPYGFATVHAGSEARGSMIYGALRLVLRPTGFDWRFVPAPRHAFADEGGAECR